MFGQFPNQSKIEVFDTFCVTEAIASSAHGINFDSPLPTAKMLPKLGELSAKLGTGGQASVFASTLTWTSSTKASDTPAESCSATTAFQQQQAVAVKAFTGIRADENASNEQNMLEIVCALGIESNMVSSYLHHLCASFRKKLLEHLRRFCPGHFLPSPTQSRPVHHALYTQSTAKTSLRSFKMEL